MGRMVLYCIGVCLWVAVLMQHPCWWLSLDWQYQLQLQQQHHHLKQQQVQQDVHLLLQILLHLLLLLLLMLNSAPMVILRMS